MTLENTDWSGGFVNGRNENVFPYKVDNAGGGSLHEAREKSVHDGEYEYRSV